MKITCPIVDRAFRSGQIGAKIFDLDLVQVFPHTNVARVTKHIADQIVVLGSVVGTVGKGEAGMEKVLLNDTIDFYFDEKVVRSVKQCRDVF